jgi:hypothetical protein
LLQPLLCGAAFCCFFCCVNYNGSAIAILLRQPLLCHLFLLPQQRCGTEMISAVDEKLRLHKKNSFFAAKKYKNKTSAIVFSKTATSLLWQQDEITAAR